MNKFDEDFYKFVTAEENFEAIFEIGKKFKFFKEKLISDFWEKVYIILKNEYKEELNGWEPSNENNWISLYHLKYCNKDEYSSIGTAFGNQNHNPWVGVWFHKAINSNNYELVRKFAEKMIKNDWRLGSKSEEFPIYKVLDDNFNTYETLRKILPSEGDWFAKEYAKTLVNTHKELYPMIEKFGVKFKS